MSEQLEPEVDAFSEHTAPGVSLIVQMRTYDVLMAILTHLDADTARDLAELHSQGNIIGPSPWINGVFITDALNPDNISENLSDDTGPSD